MNSLRNYERSQFYVCFIRKKGFLKMLGKPIEDVFGGTRFTPNFTRNRICHACFKENSAFFKITVSQMEAAVHTLFYKQLGSDPQTSKFSAFVIDILYPVVKDQCCFYEICSLANCINIKAIGLIDNSWSFWKHFWNI